MHKSCPLYFFEGYSITSNVFFLEKLLFLANCQVSLHVIKKLFLNVDLWISFRGGRADTVVGPTFFGACYLLYSGSSVHRPLPLPGGGAASCVEDEGGGVASCLDPDLGKLGPLLAFRSGNVSDDLLPVGFC